MIGDFWERKFEAFGLRSSHSQSIIIVQHSSKRLASYTLHAAGMYLRLNKETGDTSGASGKFWRSYSTVELEKSGLSFGFDRGERERLASRVDYM